MAAIRFLTRTIENRVHPDEDEKGNRHAKAGQTYEIVYNKGDELHGIKDSSARRWVNRGVAIKIDDQSPTPPAVQQPAAPAPLGAQQPAMPLGAGLAPLPVPGQ